MSRRGIWAAVVVSGLAVALSGSASAADDLLQIVPGDALAWGSIHGLSTANTKIQKLAKTVGAPAADILSQAKTVAGVDKGLNEQGDAGVILLPPGKAGDAQWPLVYFLSVTNYKQFLGNFKPEKTEDKVSEVQILGQSCLMANRGDYALVVKWSDEKALRHVLGSKQGVAGQVAGLDKWFAENDGQFVVTTAGVKQLAASGIKALAALGESPLFQGEQQVMMKAAFGFYDQLLMGIQREVALAAVGVRVDDKGSVRVVKRVRFAANGFVAKIAAGIKPTQGDLLAGLPAGPFIFAGAGTMPKSAVEAMISMSVEIMKKNPAMYGLNAEEAEKMAKISARTISMVRSVSILLPTGGRSDPLYGNVFGTVRVTDAAQFLAQYELQLADTNVILKTSKSSLLKPYEVKKTDVGGKPALEVKMTMPLPKATPGMPNSEKLMDQFFGPGGKATIYLVVGDAQTVVFGFAITKEKMQKALAAAADSKQGFSVDDNVATTAAMLPAGAQGVLYISPRGYMNFVQRMMMAAMASMGNENAMSNFSLPPFPKSPPIGMAVKFVDGELNGELVVPAAMLKAAGEYSAQMMQRFSSPPQAP